MRSRRLLQCGILVFGTWASTALAATPSAANLIDKMEKLLWSGGSRGEFSMTIATAHWQRTLKLKVWMKRPGHTFIRVLSPKKERGIGSLRIGSQMWNYIPKIDRIVKIPPSMMLQPWMGSDFSNDDLVKESSLVNDYDHQMAQHNGDGNDDVHIVSRPKPDAAVVWGKIETWLEAASGIPKKQRYFDESGSAVKALVFTDVKALGGRIIPTRWVMQPLQNQNRQTIVTIDAIQFDPDIDETVFSRRHLRQLDW